MVDNESSVLILMATYNGENYLRKQIDSIIRQSFKNWRLIVSDDNSKDQTSKILSEYSSVDKRIKVIKNSDNNHGAYHNFWSLIRYAKTLNLYDYYFFADQDDMWLENKLENMISYDKHIGNSNVGRLVYGDMQVVDKNDQVILESINNVMGIGEISGLSLFYTHGFIWGCDSMINKKLFELVPVLSDKEPLLSIVSHDNYYGKYALLYGEVKFYSGICIQHRRHDNNETGEYQINTTPIYISKKIFTKWRELSATHARVYKQTLIAINQMKINGFKCNEIDDVITAIEHGGLGGVKILIKHKVRRKQFSRTIGIYTIMFLKSYKKYLHNYE